MFQAVLLAFLLAPAEPAKLKDLIDLALRQNPEIQAARKKLEAHGPSVQGRVRALWR